MTISFEDKNLKMRTKEEIKKEIHEKIKEYYSLFLAKKRDSIPVSGKKFDSAELISATDAVLDGWWTEGKVTEQFEEKFKGYLGINHAVIVNSGSSANLLALKALTSKKLGERRLKEGDEVITLAAGFPTTVNPIIQCNCVPVFCDIDLGTYNVNVEQLKNAVTEKTKAIFLAHTLGNPFNLKEVKEICKNHNLWLIEDNCDALGSRYDGKLTGTFGDLSTFSFYPAHHITMGEGGAICTDDETLYRIVRSMRDWGRDCRCKTGEDDACGKRFEWQLGNLPTGYDHKYIYSEIGYNLKNTDLNVAIGLAQLEKLDSFNEIRKRNFRLLYDGLKELEGIFHMPKCEANSDPSWFGFTLTIKDNKFKREDLLKYLNGRKIGTRLLFGGNITKQPYFIDYGIKHRIAAGLSNTDIVMNSSFWLGVAQLLDEGDIQSIIMAVKDFLRERNLIS